MHVHGMGSAADLTRRIKPAIDRIGQSAKRESTPPATAPAASASTLNSGTLAKIIGHEGEQNGAV